MLAVFAGVLLQENTATAPKARRSHELTADARSSVQKPPQSLARPTGLCDSRTCNRFLPLPKLSTGTCVQDKQLGFIYLSVVGPLA